MLQPMFQVKLVTGERQVRRQVLKTVSPANVQPPVDRRSQVDRARRRAIVHEPSDPRHRRPRARHRRRDDRRRCLARGRRGRVPRDHRPERRRQDVAVQPALRARTGRPPGAIELDGRDITDARRRTGARGRARPDVPGLERLPAADGARERAARRGGARSAGTLRLWRRAAGVAAGARAGALRARARRPRRARGVAGGRALARRQAQARARDAARRRPARDPARRADGRRLGRGRAGARRADPLGARRRRARRC